MCRAVVARSRRYLRSAGRLVCTRHWSLHFRHVFGQRNESLCLVKIICIYQALFVLTVAMPGHEIAWPHIRNMDHRCFEVEVGMKECVELLAMAWGCTLEECLGVP